MIRRAMVAASLLLSVTAAFHLVGDTRAAIRGGASLAQTLARHAPGGAGVVIVLQPEDCLGDGGIVQRWNALAAAPGIRVTGLVIGGEGISPAQRAVIARTGLELPLGSIPALDAQLVAGMLGYTRTPFAVVLDEHGRVAGSFPAGQNVPPDVIARLASGS